MGIIEELKWRDMLHDIMPGAEEFLANNQAVVYIGFDPTAPSLGVGNLVQIMMLTHFQRNGHKPVALVGGATGMVGDPSGKSAERNLLDMEALRHNQEMVRGQLSHFLDFDCGDNSAILLNNYDWFKEMGFLEFLRDVGKHVSINYMMAKDSVKSRLESGISYTEFTYQLLQGYDFYHMNKHHGVNMQVGGSDQWGNITTGTELIRRMGGGEVFALTTPLITKRDGTKFGKTEAGNIWLDGNMTSPYKFYQFWRNSDDEDIIKFAKIFSLKPIEELRELIQNHTQNPNHLKLQLAEELTERLHGKEALDRALAASRILFGKSAKEDLLQLSTAEVMEVFEGVPSGNIGRGEIESGINVVDMMVQTGAFPSKSEARRMIQAKALRINKEVCEDANHTLSSQDLLNDEYILIQKGKKKYHIVYVN